jgi:NAD(P)-dependent dehydrogenase (short-subunit alcohol dehydrogenase family)
VTGAARGIGRAVAQRLSADGARVAIVDVDGATVAAAEIGGLGLEADVADERAMTAAFARAAAEFGGLDVVVANAAVQLHGDDDRADRLQLPVWRRTIDVNLTGAFLTARTGARRMVAAASPGTITFTASVAGVRGLPENAAYSGAKFGVIGVAQCLSLELASAGIRVNAVCPGQVDTPMFHDVSKQRDVTTAQLLARVPLGRLATVEEIADTFVWLASPMSRYVTGQTMIVDGGWTIT